MGVQGKMTIQYWEGASFRPRDWQEKALPEIIKCLKQGKKPVVSAIMGAGKSVLIAELIWVGVGTNKLAAIQDHSKSIRRRERWNVLHIHQRA